ncbi:hypothetical protein WDU99_02745 [Microbacterium sp. Mu-80]|uniref:Uncharacterized protein n=1 Tax=Microbacterium bandirmense TaxID=3122050 RepID=A0ABU8L7C8_9MICO
MILFGEQTPMPTPSMTVDPDSVTPGFAGFAIVVVIVIAVILLIWDMNRRIRRVRYREEVREQLDAEEAAARGDGDAGEGGDGDVRGDAGADGPPRA